MSTRALSILCVALCKQVSKPPRNANARWQYPNRRSFSTGGSGGNAQFTRKMRRSDKPLPRIGGDPIAGSDDIWIGTAFASAAGSRSTFCIRKTRMAAGQRGSLTARAAPATGKSSRVRKKLGVSSASGRQPGVSKSALSCSATTRTPDSNRGGRQEERTTGRSAESISCQSRRRSVGPPG